MDGARSFRDSKMQVLRLRFAALRMTIDVDEGFMA
jgi:hypothetical protein